MAQSIFSKIKAKLKKAPSDEEEVEELEGEEFEEEDESVSFLDKLKGQLPFLSKLSKEKNHKVSNSDEEEPEFDTPDDLSREEAVTRTAYGGADETSDIDISTLTDDEDIDLDVDELDEDILESDHSKDKVKSFGANLKEKFPILGKLFKAKEDDSDDEGEEEEEDLELEDDDSEPKKKIKVIHVAIIIGLLIAIIGEFIPTEEESKVPGSGTTQKVVNNTNKVIQPKVEKKEEVPVEKAPVATPTIDDKVTEVGDTKVEDSKVEEVDNVDMGSDVADNNLNQQDKEDIAPVDGLNSQDNQVPPTVAKDQEDTIDLADQSDETTQKPKDEMNNENVDVKDEMVGKESSEGKVDDGVMASSGTDINDLNDQYGVQKDKENVAGNDQNNADVMDLTEDLDIGNKLSDTILKDLEGQMKDRKAQMEKNKVLLPTDPPDYENLGRGLVYNCSDLHWACVNKVSFESCQKNNAWNSQQKERKECIPIQVYSDRDDCEIVQQHKIDSVAKTDFCKI